MGRPARTRTSGESAAAHSLGKARRLCLGGRLLLLRSGAAARRFGGTTGIAARICLGLEAGITPYYASGIPEREERVRSGVTTFIGFMLGVVAGMSMHHTGPALESPALYAFAEVAACV